MPEALILTGPDALEAALTSAALSQASVLLEPQAAYPSDAHGRIRARAELLGPRLYLPPQFADDAPGSRILIDCSPLGTPLEIRLHAHRKRWGARTAALIRPYALKVTFPIEGAATVTPLTQAELDAKDSAQFSEEAGCAYLMLESEHELSFLLFSTEASLQWQIQLCQRLEIEPLVITQHTAE